MSDLIGRTLGPYQVLEQLGAGGMATVFQAYQPSMDRYVAIKVLPRHLARDPNFRARFDREARTIARLEHRHILPVYDVGQEDDIHFLVMRYTDGGTLSDLAASGKLAPERAVELVAQVGEALDYAHKQGVVHRDIKPANVLIGRDGNALLSDFGIARIYEDTMNLTGEGAMIGTPYYMAPEQVQGRPADARSDIYALGVILYELLTGRRPFLAETPLAVALMHVHDPLPPPRRLNPSISEALERVMLRAMAKNPEDRFQTAGAFVEALRALPPDQLMIGTAAPQPASKTLVLEPQGAVTPGAITQTAPQPGLTPVASSATSPRRFPIFPLAIGLTLLVTIILAGIYLSGRGSPNQQVQQPQPDQPTSAPTASAAPVLELPAGPTVTPRENLAVFANLRYTSKLVPLGGTIWAATAGGLVRYSPDGSSRGFTMRDGLPFNDVLTIVAAPDGALWLGGYGQVARVRPVRDGLGEVMAFGYTDGMRAANIYTLLVDTDESIWAIGTSGEVPIARFDGQNWGPPTMQLDDALIGQLLSDVRCALRDNQGNFWIGLNGGLLRYDGQSWSRIGEDLGIGEKPVYWLFEDSGGTLWGGAEQGLWRRSAGQERWEQVQVLDPNFSFRGMAQLADGELWALGYSVAARSSDAGATWTPERSLDDQIGFLGDLTAMTQDATGRVWLAGVNGIVTRATGSWDRVRVDGALTATANQRLIVTPDGHLVTIPLYGGALAQINPTTLDVEQPQEFSDRSYVVAYTPDTVWIGQDDGVRRLRGGAQRLIGEADGLPPGSVQALLATDTKLWIGTMNGLAVLDLESEQITTVEEFNGTSVLHLLQQEGEMIWAGATRVDDQGFGQVGRFDGTAWRLWQQGQLPEAEDAAEVRDLALDAQGGVWLLTNQYNAGIYRWNGEQWQTWNERDGAPVGNMYAVAPHEDEVWFGGVGPTLHRYTADGWQSILVPGLAGDVYDITITDDDALWLATADGVLRVTPP